MTYDEAYDEAVAILRDMGRSCAAAQAASGAAAPVATCHHCKAIAHWPASCRAAAQAQVPTTAGRRVCVTCGVYLPSWWPAGDVACGVCAPALPARAIRNCVCGMDSVVPVYPGWMCLACKAPATHPFSGRTFQNGVPSPVDPKTEITQELPIPGFSLDAVAKDPDYPHVCPARDCGGKALIMSSSVECTKPGCRNFPKGGLKSW